MEGEGVEVCSRNCRRGRSKIEDPYDLVHISTYVDMVAQLSLTETIDSKI